MNPQLAASIREALAVAREAITEDDTDPFDPVPDGYYARPDTPPDEYRDALAKAGIHLNSRAL
jgi:hypothetical protein